MHLEPSRGRIIEIESLVLSEVEKQLRNTDKKKVFDNLFDYLKLYISDLTLAKRPIPSQDIMTEIRFHHYESLLDVLSNIQGDLESKELVTLEIY
ncbi:MAG TPA: hypothetical protein VJR94_03705 [Candidatus Nitrosocosmicus sp.]|jgi:hypothetical protein|nr:hypothetical protein [Candidatus Nitrosocosmicus sp.]